MKRELSTYKVLEKLIEKYNHLLPKEDFFNISMMDLEFGELKDTNFPIVINDHRSEKLATEVFLHTGLFLYHIAMR